MKLDLYQIDAFSNGPFTGNPAAVIPLSKWLDDRLLQNIAMENNLSETAFIVPTDRRDHWKLRWFTPTTEVPLCGHATFASGVCVLRHLHPDLERVSFESLSGTLQVTQEAEGFVVDLPAKPMVSWTPPTDLRMGLGVPVIATGGTDIPYVIVEDARFVRQLSIATGVKLANENPTGHLIVAAPGDGDLDFVMRVFAPGVGIDEDPVTGAAFAAITTYWADRLGKRKMKALQASARGGCIDVELREDRVLLGGGADDYLQGQISLP